MSQQLPKWALQRVTSVLQTQRDAGAPAMSAADLARRTGLSKSLARRCLTQVKATAHYTVGAEAQQLATSPVRR